MIDPSAAIVHAAFESGCYRLRIDGLRCVERIAGDRVIAVSSQQHIVAHPSLDPIGVSSAVYEVVAAASIKGIGSGMPGDGVRLLAAGDRIVAVVSVECRRLGDVIVDEDGVVALKGVDLDVLDEIVGNTDGVVVHTHDKEIGFLVDVGFDVIVVRGRIDDEYATVKKVRRQDAAFFESFEPIAGASAVAAVTRAAGVAAISHRHVSNSPVTR